MLIGIASLLGRLAADSHEGAVANARTASTEASRRRVEHVEVALYLARLEEERSASVAVTERAGGHAAEHLG